MSDVDLQQLRRAWIEAPHNEIAAAKYLAARIRAEGLPLEKLFRQILASAGYEDDSSILEWWDSDQPMNLRGPAGPMGPSVPQLAPPLVNDDISPYRYRSGGGGHFQ